MTVTNEAWEEVGQGSLQRTRADARTVHAVREPLNLFWNMTPGADEACWEQDTRQRANMNEPRTAEQMGRTWAPMTVVSAEFITQEWSCTGPLGCKGK